jgi:hypothetical protein
VSVLAVEGQAVIGFGSVSGTVRDYTGAGVPDVTVVISNDKIGFKRTLSTTDDGVFYATAITPASGYNVKLSHKGFTDIDYKDFEVLMGHTLRFKVSIIQTSGAQPGEKQTASISVSDATIGLGTSLNQEEVDALPSRDRDVHTLAGLAPSVTPDPSTGQFYFRSEPGMNAFLTDGVLTTNMFYYQQTPVGPTIPQEAVSEVQIVSAGAPAEFSHMFGGTVDVSTRSGGSSLHGTLYDYFNSGKFNASDKFAPGFSPSGSRTQFGANAGGKLLFSKLFWFANVEDLASHTEELNLALNPLIANSTGTAINPATCSATATQCAAAIGFLNGQLNRVVPSSLRSLTGLVRVDWRPNQSNAITVEANAMDRKSPNGTNTETVSNNSNLLGYNGTYNDQYRFAKVGYTANWGGTVTNEFRGGWYHDRFSDYLNSTLLPSTGAVGIDIAGSQFGGNPNFPRATSEGRYQLADNWTFSEGPHTIKIGGDFLKTEDFNRQIINSAGDYYFNSLTNFALDYSGNTTLHKDYTLFNQTFGQPVVDLKGKSFNVYAQDTWSPLRRLTLVAGVSYDHQFLQQPPYYNAPYYATGSVASPFIDAAPRIGLAYKLDDHTVIRAGLGAYYQPMPAQLLDALYTGNAIYQFPISVVPTLTLAPVFHAIIGSAKNFPLGSTDLWYAEAKLRNPTSAQGVLSIERQVGRDWTVTLNYVYDQGLELYTATDQNTNPPTLTETYTIDNAAGTAVGSYSTPVFNVKANNAVAHAWQVGNGGKSTYQAGSLQIRKRMSHGLMAEGSYTWSHAVDNISGPAVVGGIVPEATNPGQFAADKGPSAFNQPNRGIVRWVYQPRVSSDAAGARFINGWQFSGTGTFSSGLGETPVVLVNGQQFSGVSMVFPTSLNGSGGWSRVPFQGVNSLKTGNQYEVNFRISREIPFTERIRARLMFEAFNPFNNQYNTSLYTTTYVATNGVLRPVTGGGAGNAADGYPWGDNSRHLQVALRIVF